MAHELEVCLFADWVGTLSLVQGRLNFVYAPAWLENPRATPLSVSLPLQAQPFDDRLTRPFFAGLLPEGQLRRMIAQRFQVSGQNDLALLDQIGGECAGAVSLHATGQSGPGSAQRQVVQWLSDEEVASLLDELPRRPMLAGMDGLRLSLAGAQDKLPVVWDGQRLGLPLHETPSSHILKPAIDGLQDSVVNEGFCMALAHSMQLAAAPCSIRRVLGRSFLLVERYDRVVDAQGRRQRLHQEDFCQALSVVPEMKYQNEGGPDLSQCFELVRRVTRPSAPQVLRLFDGVIFNALMGNHDAHAKNFSLLYEGRSPVLAPMYDLISTAVHPKLTPKMAMKMGGLYKFSEIQPRHWDRFFQSVGLAKAQARRRVLHWAHTLPMAARQLQSDPQHSFAGHEVVEQIIELMAQRCRLTIGRLGPGADRSAASDDAL